MLPVGTRVKVSEGVADILELDTFGGVVIGYKYPYTRVVVDGYDYTEYDLEPYHLLYDDEFEEDR